jgi:predicted RNase H-like HicB family nuclease
LYDHQTTKYPIEASWSNEDEGCTAVVPDLAGCNAWGRTEAAAIRAARDAIAAWSKAAKSMKRANPAPWRPLARRATSSPKPDEARC